MWFLGTWFIGGFGSVRLTLGPDDLKGLSQPKPFYDSILKINKTVKIYF